MTESTFALPVFNWAPSAAVAKSIHSWAREEWRGGRSVILYAYSLGKTQRIMSELAKLDAQAKFFLPKSSDLISRVYKQAGIDLPDYEVLPDKVGDHDLASSYVILPPGMRQSRLLKTQSSYAEAYLSGWMNLRAQEGGVESGWGLSCLIMLTGVRSLRL